jgi:hypothetical protein
MVTFFVRQEASNKNLAQLTTIVTRLPHCSRVPAKFKAGRYSAVKDWRRGMPVSAG